jgi:hypothetical protein
MLYPLIMIEVIADKSGNYENLTFDYNKFLVGAKRKKYVTAKFIREKITHLIQLIIYI